MKTRFVFVLALGLCALSPARAQQVSSQATQTQTTLPVQQATPLLQPQWIFLQPVPTFPNPGSGPRVGQLLLHRADADGNAWLLVRTVGDSGATYLGTQFLWVSPAGQLIYADQFKDFAIFAVIQATPATVTLKIDDGATVRLRKYARRASGIQISEVTLGAGQEIRENGNDMDSFDTGGFLVTDNVFDNGSNFFLLRVQRFR